MNYIIDTIECSGFGYTILIRDQNQSAIEISTFYHKGNSSTMLSFFKSTSEWSYLKTTEYALFKRDRLVDKWKII
jgi:hypothetical protein